GAEACRDGGAEAGARTRDDHDLWSLSIGVPRVSHLAPRTLHVEAPRAHNGSGVLSSHGSMHMPKLDGLLELAIYVEDVERSVRFYRELFGFESLGVDERLTALGVAGGQVLLVCRKGLSSALPVGAHDGEGRQHVAFKIAAGELPGWTERLR